MAAPDMPADGVPGPGAGGRPDGVPDDRDGLPDPVPPGAGGTSDALADQVPADPGGALDGLTRDLAEVPAVEVITAAAVHLMSAAAVKLGLAEDGEALLDLDEARRLITALAGLLMASVEYLGHHHAAPLRDGLRTLQLAFREAATYPDPPGQGPGERYTGPVSR